MSPLLRAWHSFTDGNLHLKSIFFLSKQNHEPGINEQFSYLGFKYLKAYNHLLKQ